MLVRHISRKMTLISRERGMCSGNSGVVGEKTAMRKKGECSKRGRRPSNRISKAQLMYTISRGRITGQKARDGARGDGFLRLRSTT